MLVPKKNDKLRLVLDYRQLNRQTVQCSWPFSSIEEIFDTLGASAIFTFIDIVSWLLSGRLRREKVKNTLLLVSRLDNLIGLTCLWGGQEVSQHSKVLLENLRLVSPGKYVCRTSKISLFFVNT